MKSKIFINIFVFLFVFIFQRVFAYGVELETTFFNVGQGNCTVVGFKDLDEKIPPKVLLVDAGSKAYDEKRANYSNTQQKSNITKKINNFFSKKGKNFLTGIEPVNV